MGAGTVRPGPPIEVAPADLRGRLDATGGDTGLLLVGHGSRRAAATADMARLLDVVRARTPGVAVAGGWIELADPPAAIAGLALLDVVDRPQLVVQPLLFGRAYHAREDVPEAVRAIRAARPEAQVASLPPFLLSRTLLDLAEVRVREALGGPDAAIDPDGDGVVVAPSGTSDRRAQGDAVHAARLLGARLGLPAGAAQHAFASVARPRPDEAVRELARRGRRRIAVLSWSLFAGRLVDGVREVVLALDEPSCDVRWAGRFGPDDAIAQLVVRRHRAALARITARSATATRDGRSATLRDDHVS